MELKFTDGGLDRFMAQLPGDLGSAALEPAVGAQVKPVLKHIKATDAFRSRSALGLRESYRRRKTSRRSRAQTAEGKALALYEINAAPHWHLVEFGHAGPHPAGPHPHVAPAVLETVAEQQQAFERELGRRIERLERKAQEGTLTPKEQRLAQGRA